MYLLIDIGGTKLRLGKASGLDKFDSVEVFTSPTNLDSLILMIKQYISANSIETLEAIMLGFAGTLDTSKKRIVNAPHLKGFEQANISEALEKELGCKIYLENDTSLAGLGEVHYGAGDKTKICVYITISTGVGGARVVNGMLDKNVYGFEPGHQIVNYTKKDVQIGEYDFKAELGELEEYISGSNIKKQTKLNPENISEINFWRGIADILTVGLINTSLHWSPDIIILGGSLITKGAMPFEYIQQSYEEKMTIFSRDPKLVKATLQDVGGLYGALVLLNQNKIKNA